MPIAFLKYLFGSNQSMPAEVVERSKRLLVALDRERARSDRRGDAFSLVVLTVPEDKSVSIVLDGALLSRMRLTDDVGLLDAKRIGLVLPDTEAAGAWTVARTIQTLLVERRVSCQAEVFVYPTDPEMPESDGDDEIRRLESLFERPMPSWKRAVDILGACVGLLLAMPIFLVAAVAVKCSSKGPVFFSQQRDGLGGRPFSMHKFRTMRFGADDEKAALQDLNEQDGPAFKIENDPRITFVGKVLRKTSIDELPQLWNVVRGEMSLVGPRPLPCDESQACLSWQNRRLDVSPGLTCIWQVSGRSTVSFADWARMDMRYIRKRSLFYDLKLIFKTIPAVLLRKGAR